MYLLVVSLIMIFIYFECVCVCVIMVIAQVTNITQFTVGHYWSSDKHILVGIP